MPPERLFADDFDTVCSHLGARPDAVLEIHQTEERLVLKTVEADAPLDRHRYLLRKSLALNMGSNGGCAFDARRWRREDARHVARRA
jgi:hypothetical protein